MRRIPAPLFRHILGLTLIGVSCLIIGLCFIAKDVGATILGVEAAILCFGKAVMAYGRVKREEYFTRTGSCIMVRMLRPLRVREITLLMDDGKQSKFFLQRDFKVHPGRVYKLFFWKYEAEDLSEDDKRNIESLRVIGVEEVPSLEA